MHLTVACVCDTDNPSPALLLLECSRALEEKPYCQPQWYFDTL